MRILITGRGLDQGREHRLGIFELDQARALRAAGHDVHFAALDTRSFRHRRPWGIRDYELEGIPVHYIALPLGALPWGLSSKLSRRAAERLLGHIETSGWRPEVIHSHFGSAFLTSGRKRGIPTVYTEHFSRTIMKDPPPAELVRQRYISSHADRLVCVSHPQAESVKRNTGIEATVIHNIVDTAVFSAGMETASPGTPFRFAAAGNLLRGKGYDLLLDALAELRARGTAAVLTVFGGGEEEGALKAQAERLGLTPYVDFRGQVTREEMAETYKTSDAFVLSSRMETFGVVYIEAMAAGLPVIATACGGPEDFVNEKNGLLIPAEDVAALTEAMETMVRRRGEYDSAAIARFARENFSPEVIAGRMTELYREVLSTNES